MDLEDEISSLSKRIAGIEANRKDAWDKMQILLAALLPVAIAFVGYQYSEKMKEAEILASSLQHKSSLAVAEANSKVGQAELISRFMADLFHEDKTRREIAVKGIMIAIPDEGASIVALIAKQKTEVGSVEASTVSVAISALDRRRKELISDLASESGGERKVAYEELISRSAPWHKDPTLIDVLLAKSELWENNETAIYHALITFRDVSRAISQPERERIISIANSASARFDSVRIQSLVPDVIAWLNSER